MALPLLSTCPVRPSFSKVVGYGRSAAQSRSTSAGSSSHSNGPQDSLEKYFEKSLLALCMDNSPDWSPQLYPESKPVDKPVRGARSFELREGSRVESTLCSTDPFGLPQYNYPTPWSIEQAPRMSNSDRPAALPVKNTILSTSAPVRRQSLEEFYQERQTKSCPASTIRLPPGLEDLMKPEEAATGLIAAEAPLWRLEMEAVKEVPQIAQHRPQSFHGMCETEAPEFLEMQATIEGLQNGSIVCQDESFEMQATIEGLQNGSIVCQDESFELYPSFDMPQFLEPEAGNEFSQEMQCLPNQDFETQEFETQNFFLQEFETQNFETNDSNPQQDFEPQEFFPSSMQHTVDWASAEAQTQDFETQEFDLPEEFESQQFFLSSMQQSLDWESAEATQLPFLSDSLLAADMTQPGQEELDRQFATSDFSEDWPQQSLLVSHEAELGSFECPTVGSQCHHLGTCRPCAFLFTKGCTNGVLCSFCHLCDIGERKRRVKDKRATMKDGMEWSADYF